MAFRRKWPRATRANKFGAKKTNGFASKLEHAVYQVLKLREISGEIKLLKTQARVTLTDAKIVYIPDFQCEHIATGEVFYVEAKGSETPEWKLKKRLWKVYGPGRLEIWKGTHVKPRFVENVIPQPVKELKK